MAPCVMKTKSPAAWQDFLLSAPEILQQGGVDGAEGVADLGSEQAHDCNDDDGDERENDRVLNQTLTFFLGSE